MPTFIKTGLWETSTTAQVPKGWLNLTKLIKDNSGGTTGNYIPLTGTEEGKPVNGDLEVTEGGIGNLFIKPIDTDIIYSLLFTEGSVGFICYENGLEINSLILSQDRVMSSFDSSNLHPEDKLIYAQRSYVEKPETLINCLNNATPAQLSTTKSILGIV